MKSTACAGALHATPAGDASEPAAPPVVPAGPAPEGEARAAEAALLHLARHRRPRTATERSRLHRARQAETGIVAVQVRVPARFRALVLLIGRLLREAEMSDTPRHRTRRARARRARLRLVRHLANLRANVLRDGG